MKFKNVQDIYPLSPMQQGILFHNGDDPSSVMRVEIITGTINAKIDVRAFEQAWQSVVDRHTTLRTFFAWEGLNEPLQVVSKSAQLPLQTEDWRDLDADSQAERLKQFVAHERERGFDLSSAPLMRVALIRTADETYRFVWSHHQVLVDDWSASVVLKDVFDICEALEKGSECSFGPSRPFRTYIAWLRQQDLTQAEAFWRRSLQGFTAPTPFNIGSGSAAASHVYSEEQIYLSRQTSDAIREIARQHDLTLNTIFQGAWAILLNHYSGTREVVFGVAVPGRPKELPGVEGIIGMLVNTLPARLSVEPTAEILPWFKSIQDRWVEMCNYEFTPLVKINTWSGLSNGTQLFESLVTFEDHRINGSLATAGTRLAKLTDAVHHHTAKGYPLNLIIEPGAEHLLKIIFDTGRFEPPQIRQMLRHFEQVLDQIAKRPEARVEELELLSETERQQLREWNETEREYGRERSIAAVFEEQVQQRPEAEAVVMGERSWSYAELNRRANQLGHYLRELGVGPEVSVGLCVERSLEMVVAMLGILKAGGAYVPLDASYPTERLAYMLADAGVAVVLTQESLVDALPAHWGQVVSLDGEWEEIAKRSEENVISDVEGENLAYVMYTSGSTGEPKGVAVVQRAVVRLVKETDYAEFGPAETFVQLAPQTFDASTFEVWGSLLNGGRLVVLEPGAPTLEELGAALRRYGVSTLWLTAGLFHLLVDERPEELRGLKQLLSGGDVLSPEHVKKALRSLEGGFVFDCYGPTENTTFSTCQRLTGEEEIPAVVPIGKPIANTQTYVLNQQLQQVAVGVVGELYLGGDGLARGYQQRADLTAEKFVPHPYAPHAGERLYRTGDLVRYLEDGRLEFVGRVDQQVKVRGFRIEPGEIEIVLARHHSVREVVVVARGGGSGDKRLVAYVVAEPEVVLALDELRAHVKEHLPDYMMPSLFVALEQLPLNNNGKVDRAALPDPDTFQPEMSESFVAPRTATEKRLASIWAEVLEVEKVGVNDNFFELGGHSLLATQVISRIREVFEIELPLRALFQSPTVAGLAADVEFVTGDEQRTSVPRIRKAGHKDTLPLSFAQQRLWFLNQLEPDNPFYNVSTAVTVNGDLDRDALKQAVTAVVQRHAALRTTFVVQGDEPSQIVSDVAQLEFAIEDLRQTNDPEQRAREIARIQAELPFDLTVGPLLRVHVLQLSAEKHLAIVTMHHIVGDGWSMGVLIREIAQFYGAFVTKRSVSLRELPIQYPDFAIWQREHLQGDVLQTQLDYWKAQLANGPAVLELPTDRPRPQLQKYRGATETFKLELKIVDQLKTLSQQQGATLFMTLLAIFNLLLHRYTRQQDIMVGSPIANRNHAEIEDLIGFFVNTLVLRTRISPHDRFEELLRQVRETTLAAFEHQDVPFEKLVEELEPERDLSRAPLFQVMFVLQNAPGETLSLPGVTLSVLESESRTAKFDLMLTMAESPAGLYGSFEYNTDLFDAESIRRMIQHFQTLAQNILVDPSQQLGSLGLMDEVEEQQVVHEWNNTGVVYEQAGKCLHEIIEEQVGKTPDHVALVSGEASWTYAELNEQANQLAHYLRRRGVGPESLVGIMMERSAAMVVALLGVLKAGGSYLPLDPDYPAERVSFMLADAGVKVLVSERHLVERLAANNASVILVDVERETIEQESRDNPVNEVDPDNLAYVLYTSGSTGTPKGAMLAHREVVNCVLWMQETYQLDERDRMLCKTTLNFDPSVWEIFWPLLVGARIVVATPEAQLGFAALLQTIIDEKITVAYFVPAMLAQFLAEPEVAEATRLRYVICGGESLGLELMKRFYELLPNATLHHSYGPTETAIAATEIICDRDSTHSVMPIGRPLANTQLYVLDQQLQPAPIGVLGELFIGGAGLGRGYLNRPDVTAARFVPNHAGDTPGARLYRTGDLVRYLADGNLQFFGRTDAQVKLRGIRIELGEVEAAIKAHEKVHSAAVVLRADQTGEKTLVGYVVATQGATLTVADLRQQLSQKLPTYMVPATFVFLSELPLMPNGKIDHAALPAPEELTSESDSHVGPGNAVEELIAGVWSDVLGIKAVNIHSDFFAAGGHSLLATRVIARLREIFHVDIPLRSLFEQPTIAGLSKSISAAMNEGLFVKIPDIHSLSRPELLPLSYAQQRLWFLEQLESAGAAYHIPIIFRIRGVIDVLALERTLNEIVRRHEVLRTSFKMVDGEPVQIIASTQSVSLPIIDLSSLPEAEREQEVISLSNEQAQLEFALETGPLMHVQLVRLSDEEHVLQMTVHHLVADGWSIGVLAREAMVLYEAFTQDKPSPLPALAIQYADFALLQRQWFEDGGLEADREYWRTQLAGAPEALELPTDYPRPAALSFRGEQLNFLVSRAVTEDLNKLSQRENVTLFMTLLAAFTVLLSRYANEPDIVVGTPIANRQHSELENLIGFFANTLALRIRVNPGLTFRDLLRHVREVALGAYAHQDVPFELLVEDLAPQRDLNRNPLFQVMFALQNTPQVELQIPGVSFGVQEFSTNATRFDLECHLNQVNDELRGQLIYCTDLFERETIQRLLSNYESLLESVVSNPDKRVSEFSLLTPDEQASLVDWNNTSVDFPSEKRVHDLFEEQVARSPEAVAVESGSELVSYAELDHRASRLASRLRRLGVGPNSIVGICAGSSVSTVAAILGVLKAGGAYLPLDSTYPAARLDYMLENSRAQVLIVEPSLRDRFSSLPAHVIEINEETSLPDETSDAYLSAQAMPDDLAYVIYTSGSTGKPKGVAMPHAALVNLLHWQMARSAPAPRTLQFAPFSFDVSFQEIFSTWCAGGTLVLFENEDRRDLSRLWSALTERRIERLFLPFVALQYLAEISASDETAALPMLREVITAGEQLKITPHLRQLFARLSACVLDNEYGPTEAHAVSVYRMPDEQEAWSELPPIGQPIANTQLYILDAQMRPGPLGVVGELYIAGNCLARGYVNSPERTAERFLPNPFSREPGARMYCTGDLARFRSDGNIQFLGRRDGQMKIRGYRVETGEIEAELCGHSLVREAVVLAQSRPRGASELVAYVLLKEGAVHDASQLRRYLKERLPEYMLPTSFIAMAEFPLTPSGKIDRRRLPELALPELIEQDGQTPQTSTAELIAGIWSELLGLERVYSDNNFFEIGGHSLLATRVIARLREVFNLEVPVRSLFEMPTVSELAAHIDEQLRMSVKLVQPPITRASRDGVLPLSFAQERLWFWEQLQPGTPTYTLTSAFRLEGDLDVAVLEQSLNEIMRRHEILRTSYAAVEGQPVQVIAPHSFVPLSVKDLSHLPESERDFEVRRLAGEEALRPFDLTQSPLLRVSLLRLGAQKHVALVSMHHIVSDGWSMGVLVEEIATLYDEFLGDKLSSLPELPVQYADFAQWQREWLQGEVLIQQLEYWKENLRDVPALQLRSDRPRAQVYSPKGSIVPINLPAGLLRELKALTRKNDVTLFMTLLAAFNVLLHRHTGQDDIVVGTDIANRTRVETEKLIGFFVNMLVLRTNLKGDPSFSELLRRVREVALGAYTHQDVPFAKLVDEIHLRRELTRNPLFQVVFVLQNAPVKNLELTGLTLTPVEFEVKSAPFDLVFALSEIADTLVGSVTYSTELFDRDTVRRLVGHYQNVLEGVVAAPDQPLSSLAILPDSEIDSHAVSEFEVKLNRKDLEGVLLELSQASHS